MAYAYNFRATFAGGAVLEQGDDKATLGPSGSAFTDVVRTQRLGGVLEHFVLVGAFAGLGEVGVDLNDGHFEIDGVHYQPGDALPDGCEWRTDPREMPPPAPRAANGYERELIYYRKNLVHMVEGAQPEITHFCLGYELEGVKTVLGVRP